MLTSRKGSRIRSTLLLLFVLPWLMTLPGCASAPSVPVTLPEPPAKAPVDVNWQQEMRSFLAGTLPVSPSNKKP